MDTEGNKSGSAFYKAFEDMNFKPELLEGIYEYGYKSPSKVLHKAITALQKGHDVVVEESGIGKMASICLAPLQLLDFKDNNQCQVLVILANTLVAMKIGEDMRQLGRKLGVKVHVAGSTIGSPDGVHVLVGYPIKVMSLIERNFSLDHIKMVVLDDTACRFPQLVTPVFDVLKCQYRIALFTQTEMQLWGEVGKLILDKMKYCVTIRRDIPMPKLTFEGIKQHQVMSVRDGSIKIAALKHLFHMHQLSDKTSVVFVDVSRKIGFLVEAMQCFSGFVVLKTSMEMNQNDRDGITQKLSRPGSMLITTQEWAYGIDFQKVQYVVNYDMTDCEKEYLCLMGGFQFGGVVAINFVTQFEVCALFEIQKQYQVVFEACTLYSHAGFNPILSNGEFSGPLGLPCVAQSIKHFAVDMGMDEWKSNSMFHSKLIRVFEGKKSVVFVNSPKQVKSLSKIAKEAIKDININVVTRLWTFLNDNGPCMLIATDKVSFGKAPLRGLPFVINFDLPVTQAAYDSRIACCGEGGIVAHFFTDDDWLRVFHIQNKYKFPLTLGREELDHFVL